ncbi:PE family protein [Mycobacterium sp. 852002-51163_SCH5372311]|uniref:PPE family protein, SVP subgroup n=1 Tax=Mycobacterium sp. 852002-51163_SCH5372311 TaxID=1834097 RepID=UPI0008018458|nr:PE domain-containing protein [Mycobacterium sp. 852002-51163_SCH5372311]OBF82549.1 PE family protein [Mycobacterium sp. 852002-51163_SCH5372311]
MSFLTAQPEELAAAAGKLGLIGSAFAAQNAAAAAPTTGVIPAAADEVSMLQASLFAAYGTLYQQVSGEATAMYDGFVNTLQTSAGTYEATEAANTSAAASPLSSVGAAALPAAAADPPGSGIADILDIGVGNWSSAASNFLGLANGGLLVPAEQGSGAAGAALLGFDGASLESAATAGLGEVPAAGLGSTFAGMGVASSVGALSAPASWAGSTTLVSGTAVSSPGVSVGTGWTAAAPQAASATLLPGMPGFVSTGRNSAGFGAPRYGVKPIVMPKPANA